MPHLQFEINQKLTDAEKFLSLNKYERFSRRLWILEPITLAFRFVNLAHIIYPSVVSRSLTLGFIELLNKNMNIPKAHIYVTLTEHKGEDFHLVEKYLGNWEEGDDPLAD